LYKYYNNKTRVHFFNYILSLPYDFGDIKNSQNIYRIWYAMSRNLLI